MGLTDAIRYLFPPLPQRAIVPPPPLSGVDNLWPFANVGGQAYPFGLMTTWAPSLEGEEYGADAGSISGGYSTNGIVFACIATRMQVFSQARFQWQQLRKGKPGDLFSTPALEIVQHPWPGATTGDLLSQMLVDADLAGNAFVTRRGGQLRRMRPDWVSIIIGSESDAEVDAADLDADVLGFVYYPGGYGSGRDPVYLLRSEVAHFRPYPDPAARFRGMSWLSPIVREVQADSAATSHKLKFFQQGATPNMIVKRPDSPGNDAFKAWVKLMRESSEGLTNAYRTFYLAGGADATVVGKDFVQMDFKVTQGAGETRIAAAAGVHPVIVGLSEGMQGSSLNAGNFGSARRLVADKTMWHLWSNVSGSLETILPPPSGSRLWIDNDIPFLREDRKDAAEIIKEQMLSIESGIRGGYKPDSVVKAVTTGDLSLLEHTGLFSVQLQPAMPDGPPKPAPIDQPAPETPA